jgi:hypothetical protein
MLIPMPEKPKAPTKDDRLVIPLDPEVALEVLLKVDPAKLPPKDQRPVGER